MAERGPGRLGSRLALAFVLVAVAAVGLLAALTVLVTRSQVSNLAAAQQQDSIRSVTVSLAESYRGAAGWASADLLPAFTLAAAAGARLQVLDQSGRLVVPQGFDPADTIAGMMGARRGAGASFGQGVQAPITVGGERVGTAVLRFPGGGLPLAEQRVRSALERTVLLGAGLAALLALVVAWFVARRITRPLVRLTQTVLAIGSGERGARAEQAAAPGEIGELATAFDRMADALHREDSLRRQLLADVAHELRTPITILQAYCEQMVDGTEPVTLERLASLRDEVLRLGRLVQDLETLAAAEAAGLRLVKAPVDLAAVASGVASLLQPAFRMAEVELLSQLQPVTIEGDDTRLGQVVTNLLTNALKFSPAHGHVRLTVAATDGLARLEVADEGSGISPTELPHVFERFWRGAAGRRAGGSGIGLAVVAELVRAHGGRVEVSSGPGPGTRFSVLFPRS